jgi:ribonuclease P protein component
MKKVKTLKLNYEFKNVFNRGKYFRAHQVIGYILINKFGYNRLGLAISTKLCKAVGRNRIKRVIRAAYLDLIREYNLKQGYDIVFIWNKNVNIDNISYLEIRNDIKYIFRRFGLIIEDNDEECF